MPARGTQPGLTPFFFLFFFFRGGSSIIIIIDALLTFLSGDTMAQAIHGAQYVHMYNEKYMYMNSYRVQTLHPACKGTALILCWVAGIGIHD